MGFNSAFKGLKFVDWKLLINSLKDQTRLTYVPKIQLAARSKRSFSLLWNKLIKSV